MPDKVPPFHVVYPQILMPCDVPVTLTFVGLLRHFHNKIPSYVTHTHANNRRVIVTCSSCPGNQLVKFDSISQQEVGGVMMGGVLV